MMRKIKPKAVICYGEPFEEMKGKIITVDYAQTNNYKKHYTFQSERRMISKDNVFDTLIKRAFGCVDVEKGRGSAIGGSGGGSNSSPKQSSQIIQRKKDDLPTNAKDSYNKYDKTGWKGTRQDQTPGTKAGSQWHNKPPQLPQTDNNGKPITYQEFDVNNKLPGSLRDAERFVRGSDGRTYYTPDHYNTFQEIID